MERKEKRVRIQDPDDDEEEAQNVNHIQHFSTPLSREHRINAVTTRFKALSESYPIIVENNSEPSNEKLRDNLNENDHENKLLLDPSVVSKTNSIPMALLRVELVQPIPISLPTPPVPPRSYIILKITPLPTNPHIRPMDIALNLHLIKYRM